MEAKRKRTKEELEGCLRKHLGFIERSCRMFDDGFESEAERIAVSLRVIFHHTDTCNSLIRQLHLNESKFVSTARCDGEPGYLAGIARFAIVGDPPSLGHVPNLHQTPSRLVNAASWWEGENVFSTELSVTRKDLVLSLANKDGAHADEGLTAQDDALRTLSHMTVSFETGFEGAEPQKSPLFRFDNVLHVAVRHLGFEVLTSPVVRRFMNRVAPVEGSGVPPFDDSTFEWETTYEGPFPQLP